MEKTIVTQVRKLAPSASQITDDYEKNHYWSVMLQYWRLPPHIKHFPGANPMSLEESDFERLQTDDFLAALKTDGVRHMLMLTCKPNSSDPIAIMIDRARRYFELEVWANEDFFQQGSLYDGELVWEGESLVFIVFDVVVAKGVQCSRLSYRERMLIVHNTVLCVSESHSDESIEQMISEESKFLARNNENMLRIIPKKTVAKANLQTLWDERMLSGHHNDGVIFTLNSAPVETGTSPSILKWKPSHSIDVWIDWCEGWKLRANQNNSAEMVEMSEIFQVYTVRMCETKLLDAVRARMPCILECIIEVSGNVLSLFPERERTDKTSPNTVKTIEATIRNARENIGVDDLIQRVSL